MSETDIIMPAEEGERLPTVLRIGVDDIKEALISGTDDFWAMPTHVIFLALIYPIVGLLLAYAILGLDLMPLLYPLAAGFALSWSDRCDRSLRVEPAPGNGIGYVVEACVRRCLLPLISGRCNTRLSAFCSVCRVDHNGE